MLPEASTLAALICTLGKCAMVLLGLEAAAMAGSADRTASRAIRSVKRSDLCSIFVQYTAWIVRPFARRFSKSKIVHTRPATGTPLGGFLPHDAIRKLTGFQNRALQIGRAHV